MFHTCVPKLDGQTLNTFPVYFISILSVEQWNKKVCLSYELSWYEITNLYDRWNLCRILYMIDYGICGGWIVSKW